MRLTAFAPAKINLFLHVGAPRADGMHPLAGLSAFADVGDRLTLDTEGPPGLTVTGPSAAGVPTGPENLVLRALDAFGARVRADVSGLSLTLEKHLPPASGIGGGSSDAGAALRLARVALAPELPDAVLLEVAREIGADGPMCLFPRVAWTTGLGDVLTPEPRLPPLPAVLVNPGVPTPTGAVFRAHDAGGARGADLPSPPGDWSPFGILAWLADQRNDLERAARGLTPEIGEVRDALEAAGGARLVRMSGSGATVFGLYEDHSAADAACRRVSAMRQDWWCVSTMLHSQADELFQH
ncbi:MAG: 4-(cytidine 5'-diphospho)-2-C-methyl-D-erythritol kinase [Caulobacteraceae bacterium]|nr:4-(cytidine 5'-diphospho)-2-C-methyl-D-erythritol kinase [Caulobacteraceae bacterium]